MGVGSAAPQRGWWSALAVALGLAVPSPVAGELVIFGGGGVLKVAAFEVEGDDVRLHLRNGGMLVVPMSRVARILDDEIVDDPPPPPRPVLELAFVDGAAAPPTAYGELIFETSRRYGVNPAVVAAMIEVESAFDAEAVSRAGARGLMQLMPATASRFGVETRELFEPERNLEAGVGYLDWLIERFAGDPVRVFAAYNAGEGSVDRYDGVPPYRETQDYVRKVLGVLGFEGEAAR